MYNKILVPFDGSKHAMNALKSAIELITGRESQAHITVFYVLHSAYSYPGVLATASSVDLNSLLQEEGKQILHQAADMLNESKVAHDAKMIFGDPADEVCKLANTGEYDVIIMGSRGHGIISELALGSVSHKVIHLTQKPVLIVK